MRGTAAEMQATFFEWIDKVPEDERDKFVDVIAGLDPNSPVSISVIAHTMLVAGLKGKIPPSVSLSLMPWVEMLVFNIHSMNAAAGIPGNTRNEVYDAIMDVRRELAPIQATYTEPTKPLELPDSGDEEELVDPVKTKVRRAV